MPHKIPFLLLACALAFSAATSASPTSSHSTLSPEATISLLTCSPGQAIYAHYGHTAIRVSDPIQRIDVSFNYGIFDFNSEHFIWRFVTGQTDYILGAYSTASFLREYKDENRRVTEQVLNLNDDEKQRLWQALCINTKPENRTYRYNFFYDNCATRARRMIERNMDAPIIYDSTVVYNTMRDIVNHYTEEHPWTQFGISLLVASPSDKPASFPDQLFAPEIMMDAFATATSGGKPLVSQTKFITDIDPSVSEHHFPWPHPTLVFWLLFVLVTAITLKNCLKRSANHICDCLVFALAGLTGLVIFFMNFFSAHPAVSHNYLLLFLQPLHLLMAGALCFPRVRNSRIPYIYCLVNMPFLLFSLAGFLFLPQSFDPACLPILLTLACTCLGIIYRFGQKASANHAANSARCILLVSMILPCHAAAQEASARHTPKLVVGIHIDGLDDDYMRWFFDGMGTDGFRKFFTEGCLYTNVAYNTVFKDNATVTAGIVTGAPPLYNGIIGDEWFDPQQDRLISCCYDPDYLGNYTSATCSPHSLPVSTVGDELRSGTLNRSKVYSIGIQAAPAIISGGQLANGVFWIDDESGLWCTSTYYKEMPRWIETFNDLHRDDIIPSSWTPRYALSRYQQMPHQRNSIFFSHSIRGVDKGKEYQQTPMANTRVLELAKELVRNAGLGEDEYPDLLNLHLNLGEIMGADDQLSSMEIEDFYFCLDEDLGSFIKAVDKMAGRDNVLYYIAGTGESRFPISKEKNVPIFSPDRCSVLLNLYLSALYGDGKWVLGQTERDIYLNSSLIEEKGLQYEDFCRQASSLVAQMEGIQQVAITRHFVVNDQSEKDNNLLNSFCKGRSGDLMLTIETGRNIVWDSYPSHNRQIRQAHQSTFLLFFGSGIEKQQNNSQVSLFDIAPTLCRLLYVRPPTACQGSTLFDNFKK